jgi:hypothetical protein
MEKHIITYQDKDYVVKEPTIEMWNRLSVLKDLLDEGEFVIKLISESTGLNEEQIMKSDWFDIMQVGGSLTNYLINQTNEYRQEFEFKGVKYRFIDLPNLTFGEFIDIDTFLTKPENEKKNQLNVLMAFLYREVGENNKLVPYDSNKIAERAEIFKNLPIKYVHGALGFFLHIEKILREPSVRFLVMLKWTRLKMTLKKVKNKVSQSIGDGLEFLLYYPKKIYQRLTTSRNTH